MYARPEREITLGEIPNPGVRIDKHARLIGGEEGMLSAVKIKRSSVGVPADHCLQRSLILCDIHEVVELMERRQGNRTRARDLLVQVHSELRIRSKRAPLIPDLKVRSVHKK